MFTALGGQMPIRQIGHKGTKKNAILQEECVFFRSRLRRC